jgi:rRNA maturation RNase YbeY
MSVPPEDDATPAIEVINEQRRHAIDGERIRHTARAAFQAGQGCGQVITILVSGDRKLRELNRDYRHIDRATDVLSFPSGVPTPEGPVHVGDIALSMEQAARQAAEEGRDLAEVVDRLVAHGVLHLLGYDHEVDDGEMLALQASILAGLERGERP